MKKQTSIQSFTEFYLQQFTRLGKEIGIVAVRNNRIASVYSYALGPSNPVLIKRKNLPSNEFQDYIKRESGKKPIFFNPDADLIFSSSLEKAVRNHICLD